MAAYDKGARQSRAEQRRRCWVRDASPSALYVPEADLDAAAAATAGRFGAMGAASAEGRCGQCSGKRASVASVVKKGERMGMTGRPTHVMT